MNDERQLYPIPEPVQTALKTLAGKTDLREAVDVLRSRLQGYTDTYLRLFQENKTKVIGDVVLRVQLFDSVLQFALDTYRYIEATEEAPSQEGLDLEYYDQEERDRWLEWLEKKTGKRYDYELVVKVRPAIVYYDGREYAVSSNRDFFNFIQKGRGDEYSPRHETRIEIQSLGASVTILEKHMEDENFQRFTVGRLIRQADDAIRSGQAQSQEYSR